MLIRALVAVPLIAVAVAGCSSAAASPVAYEHFNVGEGLGIPTTVGTPVTVQVGDVCTKGGRVKITSITPNMVTGRMRVTDWGVRYFDRDNPKYYYTPQEDPAIARKSLSAFPGFTQAAFSADCGKSAPKRAQTELDITVVASTDAAKSQTFTVHYRPAGRHGGAGKSFRIHSVTTVCSRQYHVTGSGCARKSH